LKDITVQTMAGFVAESRPIYFYLDIGGGYSAALHLRDLGNNSIESSLSFEPNCLHVLCLAQIARFCDEVVKVYPPGIRMFLVIDNLTANYVNDIPIERTRGFCRSLQKLLAKLGLDRLIGLLIESDVSPFCRDELDGTAREKADLLTQTDYENVLRFSGRTISREEAAGRLALYPQATRLSEMYLERIIDGVHLTQRRGSSTLSFRSFPGGSSRIQAGRACFVRNPKGHIIPRLLTTANVDRYQILYVPSEIPDLLASQ
jgi:hypothetical protein